MSTPFRVPRALPDIVRLAPLPSIFISHSSKDNTFGEQLTANLRKMGYDAWYDSLPGGDASGLIPGDPWFERIQLELTTRPVFLVILSPSSMASPWVRDEVSMAWQQKNSATGKVIIPVLYAYTPVLPALATIQVVSFLDHRPYENAFAELLTAIRLGQTREREVSQLPLLPVGPPFEEGLLPAVPDPFVGREQELAWIVERLQEGGVSSITPIAALSGMGGIGKTALAAKAIHVLREQGRFPDGVGVLLCRGLHDPIDVLRQILSHFDEQRRLPEETLDLAGLTTLAHTLLDKKKAIIVLDNVEPDWPIEHVVRVLRATGVTVLLTAQQTLPQSAVPTSASRPLGLLPKDKARQLFVLARGRELTDPREEEALAAIVMTLARHTLAVKLAGAYAGTGRDLETLAERLTADPLLLPGEDTATQGERAVEVVLSQSLATLEAKQEYQLFSALGAFATPEMGRNAVLALAKALGNPQPEKSLDQLVRRALLEPQVLEGLPLASDRERVRLHALLWALAQQQFAQLPQEGQYQAQEAVAEYYAGYVNKTEDLALRPDEANIVGSLHWARAHDDDELEAELAIGIRHFWLGTGRTRIALEELPHAVAAAGRIATATESPEDQLRASVLDLTRAQLLQSTGKLDEAEAIYHRTLVLRREVQDQRGESVALASLGFVANQRGQLEQAEAYFQQSLTIFRKVQDRQGEGAVLASLGEIAYQRGQLEQAEGSFQQAMTINREVQDRRGEGIMLSDLGYIAQQQGQLVEAEDYFQQSLAIRREVQDRQGEAVNIGNLGLIAQDRGQLGQAEEHIQQSLAIHREVQDRLAEGRNLSHLGEIARERGQLQQAESYFQQALAIDREVQDRHGEGRDLSNLGHIALDWGQVNEAEGYFQQSLAIRKELLDRRGESKVLSRLGAIAIRRGQLAEAESYFQQAIAINREAQNRRGEGSDLTDLGELARQQGQLEQAEDYFQQALAIDREIQHRLGEGINLTMFGRVMRQRGQLAEAEDYVQESLAIMREVQDRHGEGTVLSDLGQIGLQQGQLEVAEGYLQQSLVIHREVQDRRGEGIDLARLGLIAVQHQAWEQAERWLRAGLEVVRLTQDVTIIASIGRDLGQLLIEHRDKGEEGCQLLAEAVTIYQQMGLEGRTEETHELAKELGCEV